MVELKEAANAAAKWWATAILEQKGIDEIQVCFFYELLLDRIYNELQKSPKLELKSPCRILQEIAEEVAIDEKFFNFQCVMDISKDGVKVKDDMTPWLQIYPE